MRPGGVPTLWFTGLSGAGKSTLARLTAGALTSRGLRVEVLDGDEVREHLSRGLGYTREDRDTNVLRIGYVCRLLSRNGIFAIAAAISPYRTTRDAVRAAHAPEHFIEIFVDCPLERLAERDVKGLYAKALRGEIDRFTGISDPYEPPERPELVIRTDTEAAETSAGRVIDYLIDRGWLDRGSGA